MAPYIIRIGPFDASHRDAGQSSYVALVDQDDLEGVHALVTEPDDEAGLRALLERLDARPVCEPALAAAAAQFDLEVGEPMDPETIAWWRHGLTLAVPIGNSLEGVTQLDQVMQFAFAGAGFLRSARFLAPHHLRAFQVSARGAVEQRAVGVLLSEDPSDPPTLGFSLFADVAAFDWHQRLMHGGLAEDFMRVDAMHVFSDGHPRPYLEAALRWANLPSTLIASRVKDRRAVKVGPQELLLLTGILNALADLGAESEATVETALGEAVVEVTVELLAATPFPDLKPGSRPN